MSWKSYSLLSSLKRKAAKSSIFHTSKVIFRFFSLIYLCLFGNCRLRVKKALIVGWSWPGVTTHETFNEVRRTRSRKTIPIQESFDHWYLFLKQRVVIANARSAMEQGSSPSDLTRPRFITGERDILVSVRVFPVDIRSSSVKRNIGLFAFFRYYRHL